MTWQTVCLADVKPTPWRNGGGTTRELVAWPDSEAWQWRASVAEVVQSGPFSCFVGVQRSFAVLQGDGVCLTIDGNTHNLTVHDPPFEFDGSSIASCKLLGGATQDFNLMVQGSASARMLRVVGGHEMTTDAPKIIAVYAHNTRAKLRFGRQIHGLLPFTFGWKTVSANVSVQIRATNALLMDIAL